MSDNRYYPPAKKAVELLKEYFLNRTDKICIHAPWDMPYPVDGDEFLDGLLAAHVAGNTAPKATVRYRKRKGGITFIKGRFRVGTYTPAPDNTTRWLCIDFDGGGAHSAPLADPDAAILAAYQSCVSLGLPAHIEKSGGAKGFHLWVFFTSPIKAADARAIGNQIAPKDLNLANGRPASHKAAQGLELFPKQDQHRGKKKLGNQVWLPWWSKAADGGNTFYKYENEKLVPYVPDSFERATDEQVKALVEQIRAEEKEQKKVEPQQTRLQPQEQTRSSVHSSNWPDWRARALSALPIESVYGDFLTGEVTGDGWLQCRDPGSPTGDRTPSAGVADGKGEAPRCSFHSFRTSETISVFDFLVKTGRVATFSEACKLVADLSGVGCPESSANQISDKELQRFMDIAPEELSNNKQSKKSDSSGKPEIPINYRQLRDIIADSWSAIHLANKSPGIFMRAGLLAHIRQDKRHGAHIEFMREASAYGLLARVADWVRHIDGGVLDAMPPKDVARDILAYPDKRLPPLESVISAPAFDSTGKLIDKPGYYRTDELWFEPTTNLDLPSIPEKPTTADIKAARSLILDDLVVDFPFVSEADRTHFVAALILPFVRRMINGLTPLHIFEAPTPRSGKSLLCDLIAIVVTGKSNNTTTIPEREEEFRKMLTSKLAAGGSIILLDNAKNKSLISSETLAAILTTRYWEDRILGETRIIRLLNNSLWLLTGNNPRLSTELSGRSIRCRIDPRTDMPHLRTGFKHDDIKKWAEKNRNQLITAVLTIIQAWIVAGKPLGNQRLGSYESWAEILGGILKVGGFGNFMGTLIEQYEEADSEGATWRTFVAAWWERYAGHLVSVKDLQQLVVENDLLEGIINARTDRGKMTQMGRALSANRDRQFSIYRIEKGPSIQNGRKPSWRLIRLDQSSPGNNTGHPTYLTANPGCNQPDQPDLTFASKGKVWLKNTSDFNGEPDQPDSPDLSTTYARTRTHAHAHMCEDSGKSLVRSGGLVSAENQDENLTRPVTRPPDSGKKGLVEPVSHAFDQSIDLANLPEEEDQ